ncbi:MAG: bifunctional 2',3'-cyclic-nucleotide 2'-phosphodiesterase/3'-nucleotidase, partial [Treponema sp.]|nr:bifunctional 2',3'-cyclic-nucleotide 2'-phosphodiesterase/3'-nucleotidase [Treponema sp.]
MNSIFRKFALLCRTKGLLVLILALVSFPVFTQTLDLTILATTDVHNSYNDYDYFTDTPTDQSGLVRISTGIKDIRANTANVLLFDNGDNIQGNPIGEYLAKNPDIGGDTNPIMTLLNYMGYDAMTLGNHEFNFGLDYLNSVIRGAKFPVVCANVVNPLTQTPYFRPYTILLRTFRDRDSKLQIVRIGVIGVLPPQIMSWDDMNLRGKVDTLDGYSTVQKYIPEMKAAGADIIVVLSHSGIQDATMNAKDENFSYSLTRIPGIDALITGHAHQKFPGPTFANISGADITKGTINGIPTIMPGAFADTLGMIKLTLSKSSGAWQRIDGSGSLLPVYDSVAHKSNFAEDSELTSNPLAILAHQTMLDYIRAPVGAENGSQGARLTENLTSYFSLIRDDYSVQIINDAQMRYAELALADTQYASLPILSAAAPFKAGGRNGPSYYTNVPAGPLAIKNIADLYVYPNTVAILKLKGADIKEWLEMSAGQFNQLNSGSAEQYIVNDAFPTYNFDVIDGVTYQIDTTQPAKYNLDGSIANAGAERIKNLSYNGQPIQP